MSTPISLIEGQARGRFYGFRRKLRTFRQGCKDHTSARQRMNYEFRMMRQAERARQHIAECHAEIERLGGAVPPWPTT